MIDVEARGAHCRMANTVTLSCTELLHNRMGGGVRFRHHTFSIFVLDHDLREVASPDEKT